MSPSESPLSESAPTPPTTSELERALATRDLADPDQGPHAIQFLVSAIIEALCRRWGDQLRVERCHEGPVVSLADNYDRLGYPADAVTRDMRYTRYVDAEHVLRSHTSAHVPAALRRIAMGASTTGGACAGGGAHADTRGAGHSDVLIVSAGMCYRRDSIDWQHTGTPHQIDLWRIRRASGLTGASRLSERDLTDMIGTVVQAALPGSRWRTSPSPHPYTTAGREIEVALGDQWIEIGECGLAADQVLAGAGLDQEWSGLAMGLGLDRLLMLRKQIPDIRLLRSTDPRVTRQMLDLTPYRIVSRQPAVRRDLSLVVGADTELDHEILGDRVRDALGVDAEVAEHVRIVGETGYDELPVPARHRLGIGPGQRNVLVRLVLRPVSTTLTDGEANVLRDRVYAALHEGHVRQWAAR